MITKLSPFTKFCCTIGNLPSSYMVSLSYEEQLLWLCEYLKKTVIPAINNNAEALEEVQKLFNQLKEYVENYFENLDVQDEINNKLDEMALSGELEDLLRNVRTATSQNISQVYNKNEENFQNIDLTNYNTDDFYTLWDNLEEEFPNKIKSYVWGYDDWDNALKYYVITANSRADCGLNIHEEYQTDILENNLHSSPYMFFTTGIHGNEKLPIYHLFKAFDDYLHGNRSSDNFILDNYTYVILPCCNPSGIDDNTRNNRNGVNINRNFPIPDIWENQPDTDKGEEAGDQTETQFIVDVLSQYESEKYKNGMVCIDFHSHQYYNHADKRVLWFTINNFRFKQFMLKQAESLKNMILNSYPDLAVNPQDANEHFIHLVTGVNEANCSFYCHRKGFVESLVEVPDEFTSGVKYTAKSHKIAYLIISNTILQITSFSGNMPMAKYNQLAQIGCTTANTLVEVIEALPNNSSIVVTLSQDSTLFNSMPLYKGNRVHGILSITKSPIFESLVARLTYTSYAYVTPKMWIGSYNNNDKFYGWQQVAKSVYGNLSEINFPNTVQDAEDPTLAEVCEALEVGSIAVLRVHSDSTNLYTDCGNRLGILTIKKPRYTETDCEIEFITVGSDYAKYYNVYYRGTLRGWKEVTLT